MLLRSAPCGIWSTGRNVIFRSVQSLSSVSALLHTDSCSRTQYVTLQQGNACGRSVPSRLSW
uniref:Uncharacterized protein n=1 Tax=Anguilla anguilla TaxID=7936 RepID=A0A0E9UAV0_ANGAN